MARRIVICADGTWNAPEQTEEGVPCPSNVVQLATAVLPCDAGGMPQVVYYHKGVGERGGLWDRLTGGAFGSGISRNIEDLYLFLITNYRLGDELFLFGFSRGAYTVRSLAGLIRNSGLLRPEFIGKYRYAYELYRDRSEASHPDAERAVDFRRRHAWPDFNIRFIGVWDTVGALGIPVGGWRFWSKRYYEFHDVALSSRVDFAFQAIAIDERRKRFAPTLWRKQPKAVHQVLEQAWFPGVHSDVGGGYAQRGLSNCALAWMWKRAERCGLGLDPQRFTAGDPQAPMGDSLSAFYRLLGTGARQMGARLGAGNEGVHGSALERMEGDSTYRPSNLVAFCAGGAVRRFDDWPWQP